MKHLLTSSLLALSALLLPVSGSAAAPAAPASAQAGAVKVAGEYSGKWKGKDESGGDLTVKLSRNNAAEWVAEMTFTFDGAKVPTKLKSVRIDGAKVELVFSWELQGTAIVGKLTGEVAGDTLKGKYETDTAEGAGVGSWSVTRT